MNKDLKNKKWPLSKEIIAHLISTFNKFKNHNNTRGYNIVKNLINNKTISYENCKRIKNLLENPENNNSYELLGGETMLNYLNTLLKDRRTTVANNKKLQKSAGIKNAYIKPHEKNFDNTGKVNTTSLYEQKKILLITETQFNNLWTLVTD